MMHPINNWFFKSTSFFYLSVFIGRRAGWKYPDLINSYATDLIFLPMLLMFVLWLTRIVKRNPTLGLSNIMIFVVFVYVSVVFEYFLPLQNKIYTADWLDVLMYGLGSIFFYFFQKRFLLKLET